MVDGRDSEEFLAVFDSEEIELLERVASGRRMDVMDLLDEIVSSAAEEFFRNESPSEGLIH